ncbi:MAG: polysaccharide export protein [Syntrophorhabdaceae bacterium]|nr:polysaccharide export protein [Syntrophorhabdaceae bacterium]
MRCLAKRITVILIILSSLSPFGCGGPMVKNPANFAVPQTHIYPRPELFTPDTPYKIQVGDTLDIKFFYNPELNERDLPVRPDGRISLQLIDEVYVAGLTPLELRDLLKKKYETTELKNVEISVIVRSFSHQKVFVDGEVGVPTLVPIMGQLTVMQAIAQARGMKETARRWEVIVIRFGRDHKPMITTVNLDKVLDGTDLNQDILLMPYDIVYVPRSPIANFDLWVDQYIRRALPFPLPSPVPTPTINY